MSTYAFVINGVVKDFDADYGLSVLTASGISMPPQENITFPYAAGDGAYYQRTVVRQRVITLTCTFKSTTFAAMHSARKLIIQAINRDVLNSATFTLRYYLAGATPVDILVRYNGGLEGDINTQNLAAPFVISLIAVDPFWRGNSLVTETFAASGTVSNSGYIAQRATDGTWTGLSGANSPASGANAILYANSKLYVAAGNNLHIRTAGTWAVYAANGAVNTLALGADGTTVYVGGAFTTINAVATNYFAILTGTTFTAPGAAPAAEVRSLAFANGVYAVLRTGGATKVYVWDGAATWTVVKSVASTNNPPVNTLRAYYGGGGANLVWVLDDTTNDLVGYAQWASGALFLYYVTGTAAIGSIKSLDWAQTEYLVVGGSFTTFTGYLNTVTAAGIVKMGYPTSTCLAVTGSAVTVQAVAQMGYSAIYAGGTFTGYIVNTASWSQLDAIPPSAVTAMFVDQATGIVYASWNNASNMSVGSSMSKSIVNAGDRSAFPATITITRTGGTSATLTAITNTFTGESLLFAYAMAAGETVTIVLTQGAKAITSSSGGNLISQLLAGSSFSTWAVSPGTHTYTVSITGVGSPTIAVVLTYYPSYQSADSVAA